MAAVLWSLVVDDLHFRCVTGSVTGPDLQIRTVDSDGLRKWADAPKAIHDKARTPRELLEQVVNGKLVRVKLEAMR